MPSGAIIGKVQVKVIPDTSEFRAEAQRQLSKIEKQLTNVKVGLELDHTRLDGSLQKTKDKLDDWRDKQDPLKIGVEVDMMAGQTAGVAARLAWLTRPRTVTIIPEIDSTAMTSVMTALAALSGGRVLGDLLEDLWDVGKNFDRLVPKIGAVALAIGGLSAWAISGVSNILALTLSLSQMVTAGLAAPGMFGGMAIGAGVLITALGQMKDAVPDIVGQLKTMGETIGTNFWAEASQGVRNLLEVYLPELGTTASKMGGLVGGIAEQLSGPFKAAIPGMFANLNSSIDILNGKSNVFASIITTLGTAGAEYLPQFATWIGDIATKFDNFLKASEASGALKEFIDSGIQGFKDLGSVLLSAAQIIGDIGKAAQSAGGSTLGVLADTMERIRSVTSSNEFQNTLVMVFQTAHNVMSQIASQSGPAIQNLFSALADTFVNIGPALGQGLGVAIGAIADALANPALQSGIQLMFVALKDAIVALAPALAPVAQAIGALAPLISALLGAIAPLITAALVPLANVVKILAPALVPVVDILGSALLQVITALGPPLQELAVAFAGLLVAIMPTLNVILAVLIPIFKIAIEVIAAMAMGIVNGLTNAFEGINEIFGSFATMFSGGLSGFLNGIKELFHGTWMVLIGIVEVALNIGIIGSLKKGLGIVKAVFSEGWAAVKAVLEVLWESIKGRFTSFMDIFMTMPSTILSNLARLFRTVWGDIKAACESAWEAIVSIVKTKSASVITFVKSLPGEAKAALGDLSGILVGAGKSLISGFVNGIKNMFGSVKSTLSDLTSKLTSWKGPVEVDRVLLYDAGKLIIAGFINGLESQYSAVKDSLQGLSSDIGGFAMAAPGVGGVGGLVDSSVATAGGSVKVLNYYAAAGTSISSEEDLFAAAGRARMVGW